MDIFNKEKIKRLEKENAGMKQQLKDGIIEGYEERIRYYKDQLDQYSLLCELLKEMNPYNFDKAIKYKNKLIHIICKKEIK